MFRVNDSLFVGLITAVVLLSACSTRKEECRQISEIVVKNAAEISDLDTAMRSSESAVVAIAAGKGEAGTAVALERMSAIQVETPSVEEQYKDLLSTLKELNELYAAVNRDLSAKSTGSLPLSDAGRAHATNVTRLKLLCASDKKARSECDKISAILKGFPVDTGQNPGLFNAKLSELKALKVEYEALIPVVSTHVSVLEALGPKLIEARAIEDRVAAARDRASLVSGSYKRKTGAFAEFCSAP